MAEMKTFGRIFFSLLALFSWVAGSAGAPPKRPVLVDVSATAPGLSAEEVERQVTIPLEVTMAGIPGLEQTRSQSLPEWAQVRLEFRTGADAARVRQEVGQRLKAAKALPPEVVPRISPRMAADQVMRYVLRGPRDAEGRDIYNPSDLRSLQDWVLEKEFHRVPGVAEIRSAGGTVKRYEVQPDPDRLRIYGITLEQLRAAIAKANANIAPVGVGKGRVELTVRGDRFLGGGKDPVQQVQSLKDPREAAAKLRAEEQRRLREIWSLVVATIKDIPIRVEDVVDGGRFGPGELQENRGVGVAHQPRASQVGFSRAGEREANDLVQGVVLARPGEDPQLALPALRARIKELNETPGRLLPGVRIEPYYERSTPSEADEVIFWVRGAFPVNVTLERVLEQTRQVRAQLLRHRTVKEVVSQIGREEGGMAPARYDRVRLFARLQAESGKERRPGRELAEELAGQLNRDAAGVYWNVEQEFWDELQGIFAPGTGEGLLKILGPDLEGLERLAAKAASELGRLEGVQGTQITHLLRRTGPEFRVDPEKCKRWGVSVADAQRLLQAAIGDTAVTAMIEGEKTFDITLRYPAWRRGDGAAILDNPVDVPVKGEPAANTPRLRLGDLVSLIDDDDQHERKGSSLPRRAAGIYREEGRRLIVVRFRPRGKDAAAIVAAAREKLAPLFEAPCRATWEENFP